MKKIYDQTVTPRPHGRAKYVHEGCRCEICKEDCRVYMIEYRARKRGLQPMPTPPPLRSPGRPKTVPPKPQVIIVEPPAPVEPGPCVLAVRADVAELGVEGERVLIAAAEAMARILDNRNLATTQPSAAGKLLQIMTELRKHAGPRRGRLAVVQAMTDRRG